MQVIKENKKIKAKLVNLSFSKSWYQQPFKIYTKQAQIPTNTGAIYLISNVCERTVRGSLTETKTISEKNKVSLINDIILVSELYLRYLLVMTDLL